MKIFLVTISLVFLGLVSQLNAQSLIWFKTYGSEGSDIAYSIKLVSDEGYIMAGMAGHQGQNNAWILRTDVLGDTIWTRTYSSEGFAPARDVVHTSEGNYVLTGYASDFGQGDAWFIKVDPAGETLISTTLGGPFTLEEGNAIIQTSDDGFVIIGRSSSTSSTNAMLIKTDNDGNALWMKTYSHGSDEIGYSVKETSDGGLVVFTVSGQKVILFTKWQVT